MCKRTVEWLSRIVKLLTFVLGCRTSTADSRPENALSAVHTASTLSPSALAGKIHVMENLESAEKLKLYFVLDGIRGDAVG
jgi:hypothetical protein